MSKLTIKINSQVCDLYPATSVTMSSTALSIEDPILRSSNFTYAFKLPLTVRNRAILGNIQEAATSDKFLRGFKAEVLADTDTIITGNVLINSLTKNEVSLNIISDQVDWIKKFESRTLQDLPDDFSFPFTGVWGTSNSSGLFTDGSRFEDYVEPNQASVSDMLFPLISYGNFFQPTVARVWSLEGITRVAILPGGTYVTDDGIPFYINSVGELKPTATFEDGTVFKIGGIYHQTVVDNPKPDEYIGFTDFVIEDWTPSFRYPRVLKECFKQAGLKVVSPDFNDTQAAKDLIMPYVGEGFQWNYGTLGKAKLENLILPKVTPLIVTTTVDDAQDNAVVVLPEITTGSGIVTGDYRNTIGGEPCYTTDSQVSLYDNYNDGAWTTATPTGVTRWQGYMFFLNNMSNAGSLDNYDFTKNYTKYQGLAVRDNMPEEIHNTGHHYRCPQKGSYNYQVDLEMEIVGYPWNPTNLSRKATGEHIPLLVCVIKNEGFEDAVRWLYQEYLGTPGSQGSDENILYRQDLVGTDDILFSDLPSGPTTLFINEVFEVEKEDTLTLCFIYFQQSSRNGDDYPRVTGQFEKYALMEVVKATITIDPLLDEEIKANKNLPAISQAEFVRDYIKLFNLYPEVIGDTVYLKPFRLIEGIDISDRASTSLISNPGIKDKIEYAWTEDANDTWYLEFDELKGEYKYVPLADYSKTLFTGDTEYKFQSLFAATKLREYTVVTDATPEGTRNLPTISSKEVFESDPRFTDWSYSFTPRLLNYEGQYDIWFNVYGIPQRVSEAVFPDWLQMKSIYNLKYERLINKSNGSSITEVEAYLTPSELKLVSTEICAVRYNNGLYLVIESSTDIRSGKSKLKLLKY